MSTEAGGREPTVFDFFFDMKGSYGGGPQGLVLLFLAWTAGYFGFGATIVFILAAVAYSYLHRRNLRARRAELWSIQECLREPSVAAQVLASELPTWLKFPTVEKCQWLQYTLNSLWPRIATATEKSILDSLNPLLETYRPGFLTKLCMGVVKMGSVPLQISGIQSFQETSNETIIDLHVSWRGDPDLRILAGVGLVVVEAQVANLQLKGLLRIVLGPHVSAWPCFAAMSMSFVGKPIVDFSLKAAKIPFDAIPGLSNWLDSFLRNTLTWLMVYPKRLVIPILDQKTYGSQESSAEPVGRLHVTVKGCEDLHEKGFMRKLSTYATVCVTAGNEDSPKIRRSSTVKGKSPVYEATFTFTVHNVPNERVIIGVYDDGHDNVASKGMKKASMGKLKLGFDSMIGKIELFVVSLLDGRHDAVQRLVHPKNSTENVGSVSFTTKFVPFAEVTDQTVARLEPEQADSKTLDRSLGGMEDSMQSPLSPTNGNVNLNASFIDPSEVSGMLLITLDRCTDLVKADLLGKSDPYVIFRIGSSKTQSTVIHRTLDPVFGEQKFELDVINAQTDILEVCVMDKDIIKDSEIGTLKVPILEVFRSNGRIKHTWPLSPKGNISLDLKLLANKA